MKTVWWYVGWIISGFAFAGLIAVALGYATLGAIKLLMAAGFRGIEVPGMSPPPVELVLFVLLALATWIAYRIVQRWYRDAARKQGEAAQRERLAHEMGEVAPALENERSNF